MIDRISVFEERMMARAKRKRNQLSCGSSNGYVGVSKQEKLVDASHEDREGQTEHPSAECHGWYRRIVGVGYCRMDFWIWRIVIELDSLVCVEVGIVKICRWSLHVNVQGQKQ